MHISTIGDPTRMSTLILEQVFAPQNISDIVRYTVEPTIRSFFGDEIEKVHINQPSHDSVPGGPVHAEARSTDENGSKFSLLTDPAEVEILTVISIR